MTIRVCIDRDLCSGYANCLDAAPDVFDLDEHDVAIVAADASQIAMHRAACERAVKLCPVGAITIEEAPDGGAESADGVHD